MRTITSTSLPATLWVDAAISIGGALSGFSACCPRTGLPEDVRRMTLNTLTTTARARRRKSMAALLQVPQQNESHREAGITRMQAETLSIRRSLFAATSRKNRGIGYTKRGCWADDSA